MSDRDPEPRDGPPAPGEPDATTDPALAALGAAFDPAVLARMANEFFHEWADRSLEVPASGPPAAPAERLGRETFLEVAGLAAEAEEEFSGSGYYFLRALDAASEVAPAATGHAPPGPASGNQPSPATALSGKTLPIQPEVLPDLGLTPEIFDVQALRRDFPILEEKIDGRPLIWLDNAATTQKPRCVIERMERFYWREYSNVHRAAHTLAARATEAYETARGRAQRFLNASSPREIVFVRGATEAINLVAQTWGRRHVGPDDEILITWIEHHSNIVPWQILAADKGARLRVAPVDEDGQVMLDEYEKLFSPRTRIVALAHVSNALGTILPVAEMIRIAHRHGARVLVDGAQAVSHMSVDVQALDADFYAFSGHKAYGPTGIGVLFGKVDLLDRMPPWHGGGNMIADVTFERSTYQQAPVRFEAGTASIGDAVGLGAALKYLSRIGLDNIARHESELLSHATQALQSIPGLRIIGTAREKAAVLSFVLDGLRTQEVGQALDREGIAVRAGHHCALPTMRRFGVESTVRPSLALYNTREEIDALAAALRRIRNRGGLPPA